MLPFLVANIALPGRQRDTDSLGKRVSTHNCSTKSRPSPHERIFRIDSHGLCPVGLTPRARMTALSDLYCLRTWVFASHGVESDGD